MRITKKRLEEMVEAINRIMEKKRPEENHLVLEFSYGNQRVCQYTSKSKGGGQRNLSYRGTKKEVYYFLDGYYHAIKDS